MLREINLHDRPCKININAIKLKKIRALRVVSEKALTAKSFIHP